MFIVAVDIDSNDDASDSTFNIVDERDIPRTLTPHLRNRNRLTVQFD